MKHRALCMFAVAVLSCNGGVFGQDEPNTYKLVTSESQLESGGVYLIASGFADGEVYALSYNNGNNRKGVIVNAFDTSIVHETAILSSDKTNPYELVLGGKAGAWTFYDAVSDAYLNVTDTKTFNYLQTISKLDNYACFSIAISDDYAATIKATKKTVKNWFMFNPSSNLFSCYDSDQNNVYLYKKVIGASDPVITVEKPVISPATGNYYESQTVVIGAEEGCTIYYTTDGSSPSASSILYTEPFVVSETTTIKAIAVDSEGYESKESSVTVTILEREPDASFEAPYTYDEISAFSDSKLPTKNVWVKGYIVGYLGAENSGDLTTDCNNTGTNKINTLGIGHIDASGKQYVPVKLSDEIKSVLNINDNRHNLGKEIYIYGKLGKFWGLKAVETPVKVVCRDNTPPYGYIIAGSGFADSELDFVFSDANATSIDLRCCQDDVSDFQILSPNSLIIKNKNEENADNVISKNNNRYVCQRLVLNNGYAFRVPFNFTAEEVTYTMNISAAGYATLCLPFNCSVPDGLTVYRLESLSGKEIIAMEVDTLEANKPVLLKGEQGIYIFSAKDADIVVPEDMNNGILKGVYSKQNVEAGSYVLQMHGDEPAFYVVASGKEPVINSFRAYMTVVSQTTNLLTLRIVDPNEVNSIGHIVESNDVVAEEYYNIYGIKQDGLTKGLNIMKMSDGSVRKIYVK
ncbi:MAG: chitobiase/beta-hexosaminidase C-terminal domain-containing protein [Roseburia sp.]|nr:chitobiase/beta-hexosaminidase C-terminal domain-containing protein [Roseburia sp.]